MWGLGIMVFRVLYEIWDIILFYFNRRRVIGIRGENEGK